MLSFNNLFIYDKEHFTDYLTEFGYISNVSNLLRSVKTTVCLMVRNN